MDLQFKTAKEALYPPSLEDINVNILAELLYEYFTAPEDIAKDVITGQRDENDNLITHTVFSKRPLPLVSEFSRVCGLTKRELKLLGQLNPIVARALEFAEDIQEEYLLRRSLAGEWGTQAAHFVSINLTNLRAKPSEKRRSPEELGGILDKIEESGGNLLPAGPSNDVPVNTEEDKEIKTLL